MSAAIREAYQRGEEDETLEPIVLVDDRETPIGRFQNGLTLTLITFPSTKS